ncbi:MAG: zinc-dependent alcohol dehydrogenase family protein [Chlamydiales bacterium]
MRAQVFCGVGIPLEMQDIPKPSPAPHQVLIKVSACGVCRTDLHIIYGELPEPKLPLILGHQIVGIVEQVGKERQGVKAGDRVGVPWLGGSCGRCAYCQAGNENLCNSAVYTGYQVDGGFAEYTVANTRYIFPIPKSYSDQEAPPLLCAGLVGFRALKMTGHAKQIGFYGFGASAHILIQVVKEKKGEVYAFTKKGDIAGQEAAKEMGAIWAGSSTEMPPKPLDAAIIFASAGELLPLALQAVKKGGIVVTAAIHMSDIPSFPYQLMWGERIIRSVANLTRKDGEEFLTLAPRIPIKTDTTVYPLENVNEALSDLEQGNINGSAVILIE